MHDPSPERFPKSRRVVRQRDFDRTFKTGRVIADSALVVHATPNTLGHWRLGLSMSRKVGNAVVRNRWKRLIREAFRRQFPSEKLSGQASPQACFDLVIRPRKGATADYQAIYKSLANCSRRLGRSN